MIDFVKMLLDTGDFPPRWACGNWTEGHGWLHIVSDLGVFSAYFAIPIVLVYFAARRKDLPFRRVFFLFAAFILVCGATHFMEAIIFWWPAYRLAGALKLFTAIVSWVTIIALVPLVPKILAMRSPEELEREIKLGKTAEEALRKSNAELEQRVRDRTIDLMESEERLRFVMDSMPQKIFTALPGGEFEYVNSHWCDVAELRFDQPGQQTWGDFIHPHDLDGTFRAWENAIATGEPLEVEHRFLREDGMYRWHITRAKAQKDARGLVQWWIGSNTDIHSLVETTSELRGVAQKLSEVDRRKNEFIATLAHELRNPLAPIRAGLYLIKGAGGVPRPVQDARAMMERQLSQLIRLVDDLMDVSRISQGKIELRKEPVSLEKVLQHTLETCSPLAEESKHEIIVSIPETPVILHADLTRLTQVFLNLINNALKYSEEGTQIHVNAKLEGDHLVVTVKDDGIGIDPDFLPHIFEMFAQLDPSMGKTRGGLGIGLSLVKRLVEMHGGRIEAKSDGPGKGAEFRVHLTVSGGPSEPLPIEGEASGGEQSEDGVGPATSSPSLRVLVVDDNRDSADSLSMILAARGYETRTAYDGREALSAAREFRPEAVLLDIGLPELNGYETCRSLRSEPGGEKMVIIAQTGWGQEEDRRETREAGFDHHLVKPIELPGLFALLRRSEGFRA